ncbi:transposase domain-containing protein [Caballeronia calidae]|nr:transposase domain-containing protein [Caballeronia calidae]
MYSLFGTVRLNGFEPYAWLKDTLEKPPSHPVNRVHELLPLPR